MSWKQYGGTNRFDYANNIRTHTLVCDLFTLREAYQGEFDISGILNVYQDASFQKDIHVTGNTYANNNLFVLHDTSMQGNLFVGGSESIVGPLYLGDNSSQYLFGLSGGNGIGINTMTPQATIDICGNQTHVLNIFSGQPENINTIAQNINQYGITDFASDYVSGFDFYGRDQNKFVVDTIGGKIENRGTIDSSGSSSLFNYPLNIILGISGQIIVSDADVIRVMTLSGEQYNVSSIVGTPGNYSYQDGTGYPNNSAFNFPYGIASDASGNLFIADTYNNLIRKVVGDTVSTIAGNLSGLLSNGYISYPGGYRDIPQLINIGNNAGFQDGIGQATSFNQPSGILVLSNGNILIADSSNNTIRQLSPIIGNTYRVSTVAGNPLLTPSLQNGYGSNARFNYPCGLTRDNLGNIYVADAGNNVIRKMVFGFDGSLNVSVIAGSTNSVSGYLDGIGTNTLFNFPTGLIFSNGSIFIADTGNSVIRKLDLSGNSVSTVAGIPNILGSSNGFGSIASFQYPSGITADLSGNLFIADTNNQLIRKIVSVSDTSGNTIGLNNPAAQITYQSNYVTGKTLKLKAPDNVWLNSKVSISTNDSNKHIKNESLIIYDISSGVYLPDVYDNSSCLTGNSLTLVATDSYSNTFLNIIGSPDLSGQTRGISIGGGTYPFDLSRSMGVIGWTDNVGVFQPSQIIVSGNDPIKNKCTIGINTNFPKTDGFVLDINGPTRLSNGTVVNIGNQPFEIVTMGISRNNPNTIIAVGSPSAVGDGYYIPSPHYAYVSQDGGSSWNSYLITATTPQINFQFQDYTGYLTSIYVYNSSYAVIGSDNGYFFYTVDGGKNWANIFLNSPSYSNYVRSIYMTTYDNGGNFYVQNTSLPVLSPFTSIAFSSDGVFQTAVTDASGIFISSDSGVTWTNITVFYDYLGNVIQPAFTSISLSENGSIQIAVSDLYGMFTSQNFGNTWNLITHYNGISNSTTANIAFSSVAVSSINYNVAIANSPQNEILFIFPGGLWNNINIGNPINISNMTAVVSVKSLIPSVGQIPNGANTIICTNGNGIWTGFYNSLIHTLSFTQTFSSSANFTSIAVSYDGVFQTAVTSLGGIYVSSNSGTTWSLVGPLNINFTSISMSSDGLIQNACSNGGGIWQSVDYGASWQQFEFSATNWSSIALSNDGSVRTVVSVSGELYRYVVNNIRTFFTDHPASGIGECFYFDIKFNDIPVARDISLNYYSVPSLVGLINGYKIDGYKNNIYLTGFASLIEYNIVSNSVKNIYSLSPQQFRLSVYQTDVLISSFASITFIDTVTNIKFVSTSLSDGSRQFGPSDITILRIYLYNSSVAVAIGFDNSGVYYLLNMDNYKQWNIIDSSLINSSGNADILSNLMNSFVSIVMPSIDSIIIANVLVSYDFTNKILGKSNIFNVFLPNLYDVSNNIVLDVSGSIRIIGNIYGENIICDKNLTVEEGLITNGYQEFSDQSVYFSAVSDLDYPQMGKKWVNSNNTVVDFQPINVSLSYFYSMLAMSSNGQYQYFSQFNEAKIGVSQNYGKDWSNLTSVGVDCQSICTSSDGKYVSVLDFFGTPYYSSDYGKTLAISQDIPGYSVFQNQSNIQPGNISMSGNGKYQTIQFLNTLFYSSNYGVNWNKSIYSQTFNFYSLALSFTGKFQAVTFDNGVLISNNYGVNWSKVLISNSYTFFCVKISANGQYLSVSTGTFSNFTGTTIFYSSDFGASWEKSSIYGLNGSTVVSFNGLPNIAMSSSGKLQYALISDPTNKYVNNFQTLVFVSHDFGVSWNQINCNLVGNFYCAAMSSDGKYISAVNAGNGSSLSAQLWYSIIPYPSINTDQLIFSTSGVVLDVSSLTINGNIYANSYNVTSDYRIKQNVESLSSEYTVDFLKPVTYYNSLTTAKDIGFIAHEVQQAYPFLVSGEQDGDNLQTVNYIGLIGILVEEIKLLKKRVDQLSSDENT
jgi:photosystem II stability/assembly factor-like uncharacterized protein